MNWPDTRRVSTGNLLERSQARRQRSLANFDWGQIRVLVATDVVAQGIDVEGISHVINYELPNDVESYVHRVRRTARAGAAGIALSFCDATEVLIMKAIEKLFHQDLPAMGRACLPFGSGCIVAQAAPCGFRSSGTVA